MHCMHIQYMLNKKNDFMKIILLPVNHVTDISFHSVNKKKDALMIFELSFYTYCTVYMGVIFTSIILNPR